MKKCRSCQTEIDSKATRCPKCQADQRSWFLRHKVFSVIAVIIVIFVIGAASSHPNVSTAPAKTTSSAKPSTATPQAHVGATVNIGGSKGLAVTLAQVIDPAQGASQYANADAGKRFVGIKLQITNNGTAAYSDDANTNVTVIGSDNQSYTADFNSISECTNFSSGTYTLTPGESSTGCVTLQLPNGVNASKVQFASLSGFSGDSGEWLVP